MATQIFKDIAKSDLTKVKKYSKEKQQEIFDPQGHTPLVVCCKNHQVDMIVALLENGFDPNFLDKNGKAPLHYVANLGYDYIAQLLVNKGAQLNITCRYGNNTILHYAVMNNCISMVKYIVELLGPCPQLTYENNSGETPLEIAIEKQYDIVANLLKKATAATDTVFRPTSSIYQDLDIDTMDSLQQQIAKLECENRMLKKQVDAVKTDMSIYEEKSDKIYNQYKVIMRTKDTTPPRPPKANTHGGTPSPQMAQPDMKYASEGAACTNKSMYVNHQSVSIDEGIDDEVYLTPSTSQTALADDNSGKYGDNTQHYAAGNAPLNGEAALTESETEHVVSNYPQLLETIKLDRKMKADLLAKKLINVNLCMQEDSDEIIEHMILAKVLNSKAHFESLKEVLAKYGQNTALQLLC